VKGSCSIVNQTPLLAGKGGFVPGILHLETDFSIWTYDAMPEQGLP